MRNSNACYIETHRVSRVELAAVRRILRNIRRWLLAFGQKTKDINEFLSRVHVLLLTRGRKGAAEYLNRVGYCVKQYLSYRKVGDHVGVQLRGGLPAIIPDSFRSDEMVLSRMTKVYRAIEVPDVPKEGVDKLVKAITSPGLDPDLESFQLVRLAILRGWESIGSPTISGMSPPPLAYKPSWIHDGPSWRCISPGEYYDVVRSDIVFTERFIQHPRAHTVFGLISREDLSKVSDQFCSEDSVFAGEYGFTLEAGGKVRGYFSPRQCIQALSQPILQAVAKIRDSIPQDCNTDQQKGVRIVQEWINSGEVCYSVDQSAATDRFPLDVQLYACSLVGIPPCDIDFMRTVSRLPYKCTEGAIRAGFPSQVSLSVGQPMGSKFSIAVYGTTMALLLLGICQDCGVSPDCFVVLNDDVVISNETVAHRFISMMQSVGVEINLSKSWSSATYAEFAGHGITRTGSVVGGKWSEVTPANILSFVRRMPSYLFNKRGIRRKIEIFHRLLSGVELPYEVTVEEAVNVSKAVAEFVTDPSLFERYFAHAYEDRVDKNVVIGGLLHWLTQDYGVKTIRQPCTGVDHVFRVLAECWEGLLPDPARWAEGEYLAFLEGDEVFQHWPMTSWQSQVLTRIGICASNLGDYFHEDPADVVTRLRPAVRAVEELLWYPVAKPDGVRNSVQAFYMAHRYLQNPS